MADISGISNRPAFLTPSEMGAQKTQSVFIQPQQSSGGESPFIFKPGLQLPDVSQKSSLVLEPMKGGSINLLA